MTTNSYEAILRFQSFLSEKKITDSLDSLMKIYKWGQNNNLNQFYYINFELFEALKKSLPYQYLYSTEHTYFMLPSRRTLRITEGGSGPHFSIEFPTLTIGFIAPDRVDEIFQLLSNEGEVDFSNISYTPQVGLLPVEIALASAMIGMRWSDDQIGNARVYFPKVPFTYSHIGSEIQTIH